jgi:oxygen-independent coproporphyrinogen-3 oxidase
LAGIYIHIPFCRQACTYCNFHFSTSLARKDLFLEILNKEILHESGLLPAGAAIETIYIGGGTPSLLSSLELDKIVTNLRKKFKVDAAAEVTLEANPDNIQPQILKEWRKLGINRLSLGVQSFSDEELQWMNRAHNAFESLASIDEIQQAGFDNFSVDLIFGSPLLSNEALEQNLDILFRRSVPHISCYALTVEPRTALDHMVKSHRSKPVDPEKQATQFLLLMQAMKSNGYEQYEISNYSKPGMRSKHNSAYWQGKPYAGYGPSAHSYDGIKSRRWNIANNSLYIQSLQEDKIPFEEEILSPTQQLNEYIMTSLRTIEGMDQQQIKKLSSDANAAIILKACEPFIQSGKMEFDSGKITLTDNGKLFADGIASDLFFNDGDFVAGI